MKYNTLNSCLLCHNAPCDTACTKYSPERILRALRFDNLYESIRLLGDSFACDGCDQACESACPQQVKIQDILQTLHRETAAMEPLPSNTEPDLSCEICGVTLENPFLLSSSVVASNYDMCARAFEAGWAGAAFKTICLMDIHEASPRFSALKGPEGNFYGFN